MRPALVTALPVLVALAWARPARADLTSWFAMGGGAAAQRDAPADVMRGSGTFTASVGVGTTPRSPFVIGGIFRVLVMSDRGADLSVAARVCTRGFARGDWGVALDLGPVARTWGAGTYGRWPLQAVLTAGLPWGFQVAGGAQALDLGGNTAARGGFAALELDFLRLSVMRAGSTETWWRNPLPADGRRLPD